MDLDPARVLEALDRLGASAGRPLSIAAETASTNDDAKRAAATGAPHGATFIADAQTAGRGRGGHAWHSPPGENLYLSIVLRPSVAATEIAPITLAVGLAVARVVARAVDGRAQVTIKWPNDVFADGRKIAGVLVEGQLRGDRLVSLVAGVGLNVRTRAFPAEIEGRATSLALAGAGDLDRSSIAAALVAEVERVAGVYEASGLAPLLPEIRAIDFLRGRAVDVGGVRGLGAGIDDAGRLLVSGADGVLHAVASGEVLFGSIVGGCSTGDRSSP